MPLPDHVSDLNTVQCSRGGSERLEPTHVPNTPLYEPMILFDHVVQKFGPDRLYFGWATEPLQDPVHFSNTRRISSTFVDNDLFWNSIGRQRFGKEFGGCWPISSLRQHEIKGVSCFDDRSIEIHPLPAHTNVGFVHAPGILSWVLL